MTRKIQITVIVFVLGCSTAFSQWVPQVSGTTSLLTNIFFADQNNGTVIGASGTLRNTTNGGLNWNPQFIVANNLFGIYFNNVNTGYVCGDDGVLAKTTNGSSSWQALSVPVENYRGIFFADVNTGYACGGNGRVIKTTNGGANWSTMVTPNTNFLINIAFANAQTGFATGVTGTVIRTIDGGSSWVALVSGTNADLYGLAVTSSAILYASGEGGVLIKSTNGGDNWVTQNSNATDRISKLHFINSNTGSGVGLTNNIIRTTNGGANWWPQISGIASQDWFGVSFVTALTGYAAGTNGNIIRTITGGFQIPAAPVLQLPSNGAVNVSLTALLDWDTASYAYSYQVQIAVDSAFPTTVLDSSQILNSQMVVPAGVLANYSTYYWKVRGQNGGATGPWSSIFRFRTVPALPNAPGLLLPLNGSSNIPLTPFFDWDSTSLADSGYTLQASLDTSFTNNRIWISGITQSNLPNPTPPLENNFRYYWRVNARNAAGTGPWSAVFNFTTVFGIPSAPTLLSPPNNDTNVSLTPVLDWVEDISAISYRLQLSRDSTFVTPSIIDSTGFSISQLTVPGGALDDYENYYWRVRTTNSIGTGPFSAAWKFKTLLMAPAAPVLLDPPNGATGISTTPTLDWDSVQHASSYRIQISEDPGFGTFIINSFIPTFSQYNVQGGFLLNNRLYYWRVSASNYAGTSPYSPVWNFRTIISPPVAAPTLISPPNGASNLTLTPTLDWNDVFGSNGYTLLVSEDSLFNTTVLDTTITPSTFTVPSGVLQGSHVYYWKARAFNIGGFGPWSVTWRFTTQPIGIIIISTELPKEFKLHNNYPNPFNPVTKIRFDIPAKEGNFTSNARLSVYDIMGREIAVLINEHLKPGIYETDWNASLFASGVYFYRLNYGEFSDIKKMILIK